MVKHRNTRRNRTCRQRGGELNIVAMKVNNKPKTMKNKLKNLGSRTGKKLANIRNTIGAKAINLTQRLKNQYNSTLMRGGQMNMGSLMASAKTLKNRATATAKNLGTRARAKASNLGQQLKNKYNVTMTSMKLNQEFNDRPNKAGMTPGAASRNLLKVANKQKKNMQTRKNNGWSSGDKYQAASMGTSLFF
jgi:hypothetical protein